MKLHREGTISILIILLMSAGIFFVAMSSENLGAIIFWILFGGFMILTGLILWFFRMPERITPHGNHIICPADGKVVVIEKTFVGEFLNEERIQISIFMSPLNVHAQWYPVDGEITDCAYHKGKHMVAWHPKSSELNERSSVVIRAENGKKLMVRQIAGAVARRIVTYSKKGEHISQGEQLGFIKFGSRVDVFLPTDATVRVKLNDAVTGNKTILADW